MIHSMTENLTENYFCSHRLHSSALALKHLNSGPSAHLGTSEEARGDEEAGEHAENVAEIVHVGEEAQHDVQGPAQADRQRRPEVVRGGSPIVQLVRRHASCWQHCTLSKRPGVADP